MHTPGPWEVRNGAAAHPAIYQQGTQHNICVGVNPRDANLIAAAPDLFEFVRQVAYGRKLTMRVLLPSILQAAKALVTQVTGVHVEILSARRYYRRATPGWVRLHDGVVVFHGTKQECEDFGNSSI
jgi:hypothetical protein